MSTPSYSAADIEVLEGLEPVRKRPGMYIGGTDLAAMHHLLAEVLDNSMDEAVAGHADTIKVTLHKDNSVTVEDNGRGIPVDPHPKYPEKSALEVILTTLHAGGKFSNKAYATSGGLHGVGVSVVNALSDHMIVTVVREKTQYRQQFSKGTPVAPIEELGSINRRNGTTITYHPDTTIFGNLDYSAERMRKAVQAKAYLYRGVTLYWRDETASEPIQEKFHYQNGLADYVTDKMGDRVQLTNSIFSGHSKFGENGEDLGHVEWAIAWPFDENGGQQSYVNTIPTPNGGTHENGMRAAMLKGAKQYAQMRGIKAEGMTADDMLNGALITLSAFIRDPQFQGQTKDKLTNTEAARMVENAMKDPFDLWLAADTESADSLINSAVERAEERARRKKAKEVKRKTATSRRLTLPGKLADCSAREPEGTELFIVEGDSAGGSAKQARDRRTQAILPLRGKILNVASASKEKLLQNKELKDLIQALGCSAGKDCKVEELRYERIVIMTDADVDGAHIATLLLTFFFQEMPQLLLDGRIFVALPPLYKLSYGGTTVFAQDDQEKEHHFATTFKGKKNVDISRFKGLGEMLPSQLKETTMNKDVRKLLQIKIASLAEADNMVRRLMGKNPEERLNFIRENSSGSENLDI